MIKAGVALLRLSMSAANRGWRDPRRDLCRRGRMQDASEQVRLREGPASERLARQARDLVGSRPRRSETETSNDTLRHHSAESITGKVKERITVGTETIHRVIIVVILTTGVIAHTRKMAVTAGTLTMAVIAAAQTTVGRAMPATQRVADKRTIHATVAASQVGLMAIMGPVANAKARTTRVTMVSRVR